MSLIRILIVEDERIVAEALKMFLITKGYLVVGIASTGENAIKMAREHLPDLIMMDITLAGTMDGIEAADNIKTFHDAPIIFLTAFSNDEIIERAKITRPYGYILKPYEEREVQIAIEIAVYSHTLNNKLKESEERYRGFVQNFLGIAFRRNLDFTPVFFQGSVEAISGYSEKELLLCQPRWEDLITPADSERIRCQNLEIMKQDTFRGTRDYCITRKDGAVRWVHELFQIIKSADGTDRFIQGSIYDITGQKKAEEALKKMNLELEERVRQRTSSLNQQVAFLQVLINTIPSPIYYKDLDRRYLGCNTAFEGYLGISRPRILGKTDDQILPPPVASESEEKDRFLLHHGGIQAYQIKFSHADHSTREVLVKKATYNNCEGKVAGFIGVMVDITDRIRAEDALKESEQRFRSVVQDQPDLICRLQPDSTILFANNEFLSYFQKKFEDISGFIFRIPVFLADQPILDAHFASLTPDQPVKTIEIRCLRKGAEVRWLQWVNRAFFDEYGRILEYLLVGRDITEKKELERCQRETYEQMKGTMRQVAARIDQIKDPLAIILLLAGQGAGEETHTILTRAREIETILDRIHIRSEESEKDRDILRSCAENGE